jgi:hypothetical protein
LVLSTVRAFFLHLGLAPLRASASSAVGVKDEINVVRFLDQVEAAIVSSSVRTGRDTRTSKRRLKRSGFVRVSALAGRRGESTVSAAKRPEPEGKRDDEKRSAEQNDEIQSGDKRGAGIRAFCACGILDTAAFARPR